MDESTIGARLRAVRREHGLSRERLAERAELSVDLIAKLEQERRTSCRIDSLSYAVPGYGWKAIWRAS